MICVSIARPIPSECREYLQDIDIAEIRLDGYPLNDTEIKQIFSLPIDLIATCRPGGPGSGNNEDERLHKLLTAIQYGAAWVDIEIDTSPSFKEKIIDCAHQNHTRVIISYHNYHFTPSLPELKYIIVDCFKQGADCAKIACFAQTEEDCARILSLYDHPNHKKILALAMGEKGKITRIASIYLGAPFTYASLSAHLSTAPGQLNKTSLEMIFHYLDTPQ